MKKFFGNSIVKRVTAVVMTVISAVLIASPGFSTLQTVGYADETDPYSTNKKKVITEWKRCYDFNAVFNNGKITEGELGISGGTEVKVLIAWESGGHYYAAAGTERDSNDKHYYGYDLTTDYDVRMKKIKNEFFTDTDRDCLIMQYVERCDYEGCGLEKVYLYFNDKSKVMYDDDNSLKWNKSGGEKTEFHYTNSTPYFYDFFDTYITSGYWLATPNWSTGFVNIRGETHFELFNFLLDHYIDKSGGSHNGVGYWPRLTINSFGAFSVSYDTPQFYVYTVSDEQVYSELSSFTVRNGNTLQIKNNSWISDGSKIVVEPGAVLSISGNVVNDGIIENYGTVIVNEGASIYSAGEISGNSGTIINYGSDATYSGNKSTGAVKGEGNFIIMEDANVILPSFKSDGNRSGAIFALSSGANLQNYGTLFVPTGMVVKSATIYNAKTAVISSHNVLDCSPYELINFKWSKRSDFGFSHLQKTENGKTVPLYYNNFNNHECYIVNYGTWNNFSEYKNGGKITVVS